MEDKNEIRLSIGIWGFEDGLHNDISSKLNVRPTQVFVKGQPMNTFSTRPAKKNAWFIEPKLGYYAPFEEQMDEFLDIIESRKEVFKELGTKYLIEISCGLYINTDTDESTPSVHLTKRYHKVMQDLDIEFDVDIILLADE